jgi:hypothetical protein
MRSFLPVARTREGAHSTPPFGPQATAYAPTQCLSRQSGCVPCLWCRRWLASLGHRTESAGDRSPDGASRRRCGRPRGLRMLLRRIRQELAHRQFDVGSWSGRPAHECDDLGLLRGPLFGLPPRGEPLCSLSEPLQSGTNPRERVRHHRPASRRTLFGCPSSRFQARWWRGVKPTHLHFAHTVAIPERSCRWSAQGCEQAHVASSFRLASVAAVGVRVLLVLTSRSARAGPPCRGGSGTRCGTRGQ